MYNNKAIRRVVRAGRRSTIGNRVTGYNLFEGSNPLLSAILSRKSFIYALFGFYFFCDILSFPHSHIAKCYIKIRLIG